MNRINEVVRLLKIYLFIFFSLISIIINSVSFSQEKLDISVIDKTQNLIIKDVHYNFLDSTSIFIHPCDNDGNSITGLNKESIQIKNIRKNAVIKSVIPVSNERDKKVRVLLFLDNSSSMSFYKDEISSILDNLIKDIDERSLISVIDVDENSNNEGYFYEGSRLPIRILESEKDRKKVKEFYLYSFQNLCTSTYLYDELFTGLKSIKNDTNRVDKNIGIIISDGQDTKSTVPADYFNKYDFSGIVLYAINFQHNIPEDDKMNSFLWTLTKKTGGAYFDRSGISALMQYIQQIAHEIIGVNKGYIVNFAFQKINPRLIYKLPEKERETLPDSIKKFNGLILQNIKIRESFPLLNYIFFKPGDIVISSKYKRFNTTDAANSFSENLIQGGALDYYYNILNIIGERMRKYPDASLKLTGCNIGGKLENERISIQRAFYIKDYLVRIWNINQQRISLKARNLPEKLSDNSTLEGQDENCRVEIQSDNWQILKPVTFQQNYQRTIPSIMSFSLNSGIPENEKEETIIEKWSLIIKRNNEIWRKFESKNNKEKFEFDWKNITGDLPGDEVPFEIFTEVVDNSEQKISLNKIIIPVKQIGIEKNYSDTSIGESINKISLVLFDFGKYELDPKNESIMKEFVLPKLSNRNLYVTINGFTDNIGPRETNIKLSENRSKAVMKIIKSKIPEGNLFLNGYGPDKPIFNNKFPEGRFYNRTVQLLIQNFRPADRKSK
jgi:outer membrane protein OmpA-like peptidoglycan-associated protein